MWHETTDPDIVNQFAATGVAPSDLRKQIEAAFQRINKQPKRKALREPDLYWEEPGLHGSGTQAKLRGTRLASSKIARGRLPASAFSSTALPPLPSRGPSAGQVAVIAGAVGAGALAWYLWKRDPKAPGASLPDWAMT